MNRPQGGVRAHTVVPRDRVGRATRKSTNLYLPFNWFPNTPDFQHNDTLNEAATIVSNLLMGKPEYKIAGMYVEFENVADPEDAVEVPAFDADTIASGIEYYDDLAGSSDRDYLRVPLVASQLTSADSSKYPGGNKVTWFAQTTGLVGVHGKPFADTYNSKMFGGALVAFLAEGDPTQDLVYARFYFDAERQIVKLPSSQIGLEWYTILR